MCQYMMSYIWDMLENVLILQLDVDEQDLDYQQDETPPHFNN